MLRRLVALSLLATTALIGCSRESQPVPANMSAQPAQQQQAQMKVESAAIKEGQPIPRQYTCDGINISPPLEWSGVPKSAKTIAIVADDPDAPAGTWVHWVLYNLPAENIGLVENVPATDNLKAGGFQGKNDFGKPGYGGPCPPSGTHRYFFRVYALDTLLDVSAGSDKRTVEKAMKDHILGSGELIGMYKKSK